MVNKEEDAFDKFNFFYYIKGFNTMDGWLDTLSFYDNLKYLNFFVLKMDDDKEEVSTNNISFSSIKELKPSIFSITNINGYYGSQHIHIYFRSNYIPSQT